MSFEILEHPADMGFRTRGNSLPELFANCGHALVAIILDASDVREREAVAVAATGGDRESLVVNWLNELLYYVDGKRWAPARFEIARLDETSIECTAWGEPRDPQRHPAKLVVKAVTYHQLTVKKTNDGWVAEVYLDI